MTDCNILSEKSVKLEKNSQKVMGAKYPKKISPPGERRLSIKFPLDFCWSNYNHCSFSQGLFSPLSLTDHDLNNPFRYQLWCI